MWIHLNLIMIGLMTIFVPCLYYTHPQANIILSTFLFFSGIYLTTLYFILFYYKETKSQLEKDYKVLQEELNDLKKEKIDMSVKII
jgi:cell division protein FtsB